MRLIVWDRLTEKRINFYPVALSRLIWELRCGMTSLLDKLVARIGATDVACFVPDYMAAVYRAATSRPVNDPATLRGDDLLVVSARVKADDLDMGAPGPSQVALDADGEVLAARIARADLERLDTS